jgi:hypothetical protein
MIRKNRLGFDHVKLASLARDLAMNVKDVPDVLKDYGITEEMAHELEQIEFFRHALETAIIEWNGPKNTPARVGLNSAALLEKGLTVIGARMMNREEPLTAAVDAGRLLAKLAGIGEKEKEASDAERFVITINLGADEKIKIDKPIAKDVTPAQRALAAITKDD